LVSIADDACTRNRGIACSTANQRKTAPGPRLNRFVAALLFLIGFLISGAPSALAQSAAQQEAWRQATSLFDAGRYLEAEAPARRSADLARAESGEETPQFERSITLLAMVLQEKGRYAEAETLFRRSLEIREHVFGPADPKVAPSAHNLAVLFRWQSRLPEAEAFARRAVTILEKGPEDAVFANVLNGLANVLQDEGKYKEAEPLQRRALAIREKVLGPDEPLVAESLFNLGELLEAQGRYPEAEASLRRSAAIREKKLGPNHPSFATSLSGLGKVLERTGRYGEAEAMFKRCLAINESLNPQSNDVAACLNNLAGLYQRQGRLDDAERAYHRALTIHEGTFGPDSSAVGTVLGNIGQVLSREGRYAEAEPIMRRALETTEKALGPSHPETATEVENLADVLEHLGRFGEAETFARRALKIREEALGPEHLAVSVSLMGLDRLLGKQRRLSEAEPLARRALQIRIKVLGPEANDTATAAEDLADIYAQQGRFSDAEAIYRKAIAIKEKVLGPTSADVASTLFFLAAVLTREHRDPDARLAMRRASEILAAQPFWGSDKAARARVREARPYYLAYSAVAARMLRAGYPDRRALADELFAALQWMKASDTASSLSHMAARFSTGNDALASLLRTQQDAQTKLSTMRAAILRSEGMGAERDTAGEAKLRADADALAEQLERLDATVTAKFPAYAELANPRPVSVAETQALLAPDEALIVAVTDTSGTVVSVTTTKTAQLRHVDLNADALTTLVKKLRSGLAPAGPAIPPFPAGVSYELYRQLLAPVESNFAGAKHLIFVGDGALESLPLSVLLTAAPPANAMSDPKAMRNLAWLGRRYAVSVLPSVSALKSLRQSARPSKATQPFLGIGDPLLKHHPALGGARSQLQVADRGMPRRAAFRGDAADLDYIRSLPSLPETADELEAEARLLHASPDSLRLRERATVKIVTHEDFTNRRIVAFATHALLGDPGEAIEPALVMTPPATPSPEDDGLLRASAIAALKLDADVVVLSACNTAASDGTPGADGFSGLAKAFLFAGARALVVSHWSVESKATVELMKRFFTASAEPGVGRAEALRRAMLALMADPNTPEFAHPFYWAPFVVVGEGGRAASPSAAARR
jgi:CHAT domain-containing protein/tetratricopeptide (TPR) repeat protein